MDDNYCILVSPALFAGCVMLMHEYNGSTTLIGHYFEGTGLHYARPPRKITSLLLLESNVVSTAFSV